MTTMDITIIGAGPRGIMTLGRLIAWHAQAQVNINVIIVDPFPVGGHVWRTDQPPELLMNTPAQQITIYADDSVRMAGANSVTGPNLAEWSDYSDTPAFIKARHFSNQDFFLAQVKALQANDYAPRNVYGVYLQWAYEDLLSKLPSSFQVTFKRTEVTAINRTANGYTVQAGEQNWPADQVVLTIGHYVMRPTEEEQKFQRTAAENGGFYLPPILPGDANFSAIDAGETVLMRGVGLSFYDYVAMLTAGRGGQFSRAANGQLVYTPSGNEPRVIAGSRRGFPYYPKGYNQKGYGEQVMPAFLTDQRMVDLAADGGISGQSFFDLLKRDVELIYYTRLIKATYPHLDVKVFEKAFTTERDPESVIAQAGFKPEDRLNWNRLVDPFSDVIRNQPKMIPDWLKLLVTDAKLGTKTGPLTSGLEVLRDLRDQVRFAVEHNLFKPDDYLNFLLRWYTPTQDFMAVGPPVIRLEQLQALMAAGIVEFMKPNMSVRVSNGRFVAQSANDETIYSARVLIEARTPGVDAAHNADPVLESLLAAGLAVPDQRRLTNGSQFFTHAVSLDPKTDQLMDHNGQSVVGLYLFGIPSEGLHWMTTASPRPGVNDGNLIAADRIAQQIVTGRHNFDDHLNQ
ncbi:hypothetical protein GM612_07785 [Lactobacillus sp. CRM56-3]|uniref:FAD-dependent urate hydroxylase HpyO/Asp monooxygenase CreE-like FAD/NAD(P)-binding domain-containing protein n=2 Tax=Secundilactobacillus folii TaxID=2678357 RepID=A0A7X3C3E9_9LACO|nr:hypothetical protein [Secundilactobacillus folii]